MTTLNTDVGVSGADPFKLSPAPPEVNLPDQRKKDDLFKDYSTDLRILLFVTALAYRFLQRIQGQLDTTQSLSAKDSIISNLKIFKSLLLTLQEEDLSQNLEFAFSLSYAWHSITDYFALAPRHERKNDFFKEGALLIESINHYPPKDEHSLGFYLTHYAGENWLPFPFMTIIKSLHEEHFAQPQLSHLEVWIQTITGLIDSFMRNALSSPHLASE